MTQSHWKMVGPSYSDAWSRLFGLLCTRVWCLMELISYIGELHYQRCFVSFHFLWLVCKSITSTFFLTVRPYREKGTRKTKLKVFESDNCKSYLRTTTTWSQRQQCSSSWSSQFASINEQHFPRYDGLGNEAITLLRNVIWNNDAHGVEKKWHQVVAIPECTLTVRAEVAQRFEISLTSKDV